MPLTLYSHPFSSYCQKVLIALWENGTPFTYRHLEHEGANEERLRHWPLNRFPVLVDGERVVAESSIIIEYLALHHPGPAQLLPADPAQALEVRLMDRFFDNYIMTPMQQPVNEALREDSSRLDEVMAKTRAALDVAYGWLENRLSVRPWAAGDHFSLADCAAAPSLFYADWVHEITPAYDNLRAYRARLLAHPSVRRCVEDARPYRPFFPLGAPDRD